MNEQLKHKILILLNSLLESQTNGINVSKIMQYIPAENLANNLVNIFINYVTLYGTEYLDDAFGHVEERPDEVEEGDEKKSLLYYETIIESGFLAYFLLISYNDVMKNEEISIDWSDDYVSLKGFSYLYLTTN